MIDKLSSFLTKLLYFAYVVLTLSGLFFIAENNTNYELVLMNLSSVRSSNQERSYIDGKSDTLQSVK